MVKLEDLQIGDVVTVGLNCLAEVIVIRPEHPYPIGCLVPKTHIGYNPSRFSNWDPVKKLQHNLFYFTPKEILEKTDLKW